MFERKLADISELNALLGAADYVDVKTVESGVTLREFVAGAVGFRPRWVTALFGVRAVLARLLGLEHVGPPSSGPLRPEQIPFVTGGKVGFFTVTAAEEDRFLLLEAADTHLTGYLAFVADPLVADPLVGDQLVRVSPASAGRRRFRAVTVVRFHRWTGPLYFTVVRPFHHLVVGGMVRAGAGSGRRRSASRRDPASGTARQAQNRNSPAPTAAR